MPFKILVTLATLGYVVYRLCREDGIQFNQLNLSAESWGLIGLVVLMMPLNLGLEAAKWRIMVKKYYPNFGFFKTLQAVFSGLATGIFTPNRVGEYAGRVLYLEAGRRIEAGTYMFVDRLFQMGVTLWAGMLGLFYLLNYGESELGQIQILRVEYRHWFWTVMLVLGLIMLFLLFNAAKWSQWFSLKKLPWPIVQKLSDALVELPTKLLIRVAGLGTLRYMVFSLQYLLMMQAFGYEGDSLLALAMIASIFLFKSIVPVITITEIGIRESVALWIMGSFAVSTYIAFSSTFFLYLINIILPALIGLVFLYRIRI